MGSTPNAKADGARARGAGPVATMAFVDSHTEGEPTRVVLDRLPAVPGVPARALLEHVRDEAPWLRGAVVDEPRGSEALVGALLFPPVDAASLGRVLFCNNVGWLPMCVHATIGLARTLVHRGRIEPGPHTHRIDTPAGAVGFRVKDDAGVEVDNVACRRVRSRVSLASSHGPVVGDVVWGGNWFFLVRDCPLPVRESALDRLHALAHELRAALDRDGIRGEGGVEIDHVQLCGPPLREDADAKNFVLCPGGAHDRSPCGTGTSARVACLAADGELAAGATWRQEGIAGTVFEARYRRDGDAILPTIEGRAFVTAQGELCFDPRDALHGARR